MVDCLQLIVQLKYLLNYKSKQKETGLKRREHKQLIFQKPQAKREAIRKKNQNLYFSNGFFKTFIKAIRQEVGQGRKETRKTTFKLGNVHLSQSGYIAVFLTLFF